MSSVNMKPKALRLRGLAAVLLTGFCSLRPGAAQTAKPAAGSAGGATQTFAIESEMMTYEALESNSESVGCDIAGYLYGSPVTFNGSAGIEKCSVAPGAGSAPGVILLPFDENTMKAFQAWRSSMAIMAELKIRTAKYCGTGTTGATSPAGGKGAVGAVSLSELGPAGEALGLAQGVLNAFSSQTDATPVMGTVQDQTFLNGVARQLRVLGISVLSPSTYAPYALTGINMNTSPFLAALTDTLKTRDCMINSARTDPADPVLAGQLTELNLFIAGLGQATSPDSAAAARKSTTTPPQSATTPSTASGADSANSPATAKPTVSTASAPSPAGISEILLADGLAQRLGFTATGQEPAAVIWQHVLLLKALESGGTKTQVSNILGTRIRYSGGAVGTFALIQRDGTLECAGNVFDFGGNVAERKFGSTYRSYSPHPSSQLVFTRGSCSVHR